VPQPDTGDAFVETDDIRVLATNVSGHALSDLRRATTRENVNV
jgi:hypothetical protein